MKTPRKSTFAAAAALSLAMGLTACGSDESTSGSASETTAAASESASAEASPVAELDTLNGVDTSVTLDQGFVDALTTLGVTPGVVGDATLEGGAVAFPITGGNATYYDPESGVRPYVQGEIQHEGSGLSLSAGGTTVELTDFVVDPGESVLTGTVSAGGEVVAEDANLFFLDGRTLNPLEVNEAESTAVLEGTTVKLHPDAVALLSETFSTDQIPDFLTVGIAEITLALPGYEGESEPTAGAEESASADESASAEESASEEPTTEESASAEPSESASS